MNKIGFKNFRKFKLLPLMDIAPITLMVGCNNSGKSTFVKGLLMAYENIYHMMLSDNKAVPRFLSPQFNFDITKYDAGSSDFSRNLNFNADEPEITFSLAMPFCDFDEDGSGLYNAKYSRFFISFKVSNTKKTSKKIKTLCKLSSITILDKGNLLQYDIDFNQKSMKFTILGSDPNGEREDLLFMGRVSPWDNLNAGKHGLRDIFHNPEIDVKIANISSEEDKKALLAIIMPLQDYSSSEYLSDYMDIVDTVPLARYINNLYRALSETVLRACTYMEPNLDLPLVDNKMTNIKIDSELHGDEIYSLLKRRSALISNSVYSLMGLLDYEVINIKVHDINRSTRYKINDDDFLTKSIHRYISFNSDEENSEKEKFFRKWLKEFEIAYDYDIKKVDDKFYSFKLEVESGKWINLADLGTGAIQIVILLLNLSVARSKTDILVIVEEPEQNLHPKFQSRLADLLFDLKNTGDKEFRQVRVLVETHSEYLIRRAQVLVAKMNAQKSCEASATRLENPFKIYYFGSEGIPYDMGWQKNGKFIRSFGEGFFDEADKSLFELMELDDE